MVVLKKIMVLIQAGHLLEELIPPGLQLGAGMVLAAKLFSTMPFMESTRAFVGWFVTLVG
jgi:hypothetical protein